MQEFLIGRQQITDRDLNVFAYELLFRDASGRAPQQAEATEASNQVIVNSLLEAGLDRVVGPHRAFINFTRDNILSGTALLLPREKVVIEVLETVTIDDALVAAVEDLSRKGYMIALDDFVYSDAWLPLVRAAHIIKLDIHQLSPDASRRYIADFKKFSLKFLAEKVETQEQHAEYRAMGCDYFQGFLFSRPHILQGKRVGAGQHAVINLLAEINRANVEMGDLAKSISLDIGLSYKLLRYINSSSLFRLPQKVESIQRAILCLGLNEVRRWANLVALASFPDTPKEVVVLALARAKLCELLGRATQQKSVDQYFLVGLMSMLDQMMGVRLEEVLKDLPLAEEVVQALLTQQGRMGEALDCAVNYECWNLDAVSFEPLAMADIGRFYVESVAWANDVLSSI
jgi:c-di-GMP phosphodiesterase